MAFSRATRVTLPGTLAPVRDERERAIRSANDGELQTTTNSNFLTLTPKRSLGALSLDIIIKHRQRL